VEEIFEELVKNNMIKKSVVSKFDDFEGEIYCGASALRGEPYELDPIYGLGDIRQVSLKKFKISYWHINRSSTNYVHVYRINLDLSTLILL